MMNVERDPACVSASRRRRDRRLRSFWRHECMAVRMALATAAHHSSLRVSSASIQTEYVAGPAPVTGYVAPAPAVALSVPSLQLRPAFTAATFATGVNLDVTSLVYPQFSSTAVEGSASQVVGSLSLGEVFAAPVFHQVHQEQLAGGDTTENISIFPVVLEQGVVGSLPPAEEFTEPVFTAFHQEQFSAGETIENIPDFPVVQEQVLVQAIPRLVGSSPPVDEFTACVAMRPLPLVEVQPSSRAPPHAVEAFSEFAPMVQILDTPVLQLVDYEAEALRLLDRPIAEQVIAVPTVSCASCPSRSRVPEPQSADQLVEVPTVLTPTRIALQIAEQIVDAPVRRGRVHGSLPGQSSATSFPDSIEWVELSDANGRPYFWNRRTLATVRKAPLGVQVVWVGVKDEVGGTWYWHRRTRATDYSLPPLPPE